MSEIFETAWKMDETETRRKRPEVSTAPTDNPDAVTANENGEYLPEVAMATRENQNHDNQGPKDGQDMLSLEGEGASEIATVEKHSTTVPDREVATIQRTKDSGSGEGAEPPVAREGTENHENRRHGLQPTNFNAGKELIAPMHEPRRVSFSAVSANDAVRSCVRSGAYTLPFFGVTSGSSSFSTLQGIPK